MIDETDWSEKAAVNWTERYLAIMEECIPRRYLRNKCNLPWLSREILQLIHKSNAFLKKARIYNEG